MKAVASRWNPRNGPAANARRQLPPLAESFFASTRSALAARCRMPSDPGSTAACTAAGPRDWRCR
jgi:hypothetical protein